MGERGQLFITVKLKLINIEGVMETLVKYHSNNCRQELSMDAEISGWKMGFGIASEYLLIITSVEQPGRHHLSQVTKVNINYSAHSDIMYFLK